MKRIFSGYAVTSHSSKRAIISGPNGGMVVRDGEDVIIEGIDVTVTIVPTGVILSSKGDKIKMPFDRSLTFLGGSTATAAPAAATGLGGATPGSGASLLPPSLTK